MRDHSQVGKGLAALAAGTLSGEEETRMRAHLAECADCARALERWQRLLTAVERLPEATLPPASLARIAARARARREEVLERSWNRLVFAGLVLYGWALFLVVLPLLPTGVSWVAEQFAVHWFAVVVLGLGLWWTFCWVIGLALLPLLRGQKVQLEEKIL